MFCSVMINVQEGKNIPDGTSIVPTREYENHIVHMERLQDSICQRRKRPDKGVRKGWGIEQSHRCHKWESGNLKQKKEAKI